MSVIDPVYIVPAATEASIRATRALAVANGGGLIKLPAGSITLAAALPVDSGIRYIGAPINFTAPTGQTVPDSVWSASGGTRLVGDGTFAAFSGNVTPAGSPSANFAQGGVYGFGVEEISFDNFTSAVEIGATNVCGLIFGVLRRLFIKNTTSYALNLVNPMHLEMHDIWGLNCFHAPRFAADCPLTTLQPGNFKFGQMVFVHGSSNTILSKGYIFEAKQDTNFNEIYGSRLQLNRFGGTEVTQTWTITSGNSTITVPDASKFAVGIPVVYAGGSNSGNLSTNRIYFIVAVDTGLNMVQISDTPDGTAITPSTTPTSPSFKCYGFPNLAIYGSATGGHVTNMDLEGLDLEGNSSAALVLANCNTVTLGCSQWGASNYTNFVARSAMNVWMRNVNGPSTDIDTNSRVYSSGSLFTGRNFTPQGIFYDTVRGIGVLSLRTVSTLGRYDLEARYSNRTMYPSMMAMGQHQETSDATSLTLANSGDYTFAGSSPATWTLPTITDAAESSSMVGSPFNIVNAGSATITVNTSSSQTLNGISAKTSTTITAGASCEFRAAKTAGGTLFWQARPCAAPA